MKRFSLFLLALFALPLALMAQSPVGVWTNEAKEAQFEIFDQGGKLFGKIVSLKEPNDKDGKPKTDTNNPDAAQKSKPLVGLVFLKGFTSAGNGRWENGSIYDPKNGKTYKSYMQMSGANKIEVRGFIGFSMLGRSQNWTRIK
ncbi:MAG: DUF2147 domain-containing protein [Verrucomicrobia bacterium]|nr:DUF2147 domain-containing protein [Verrucomicrobiota bacterium]